MKKFGIMLGIAVVAMVVSACGGGDADANGSASNAGGVSAKAAGEVGGHAIAGSDKDELFLHTAHAMSKSTMSDAELIERAHKVCDLYRSGWTFDKFASTKPWSDMDPTLVGVLVGSGPQIYCSEYVGK